VYKFHVKIVCVGGFNELPPTFSRLIHIWINYYFSTTINYIRHLPISH